MKQFIQRAIVAMFALCGILIVTQTCFADTLQQNSQYASQPVQSAQVVQKTAQVNPPVGNQVMPPTQMRRAYTRQEIRSLPITARPNRPGHFIGNTVRRRAGVGY